MDFIQTIHSINRWLILVIAVVAFMAGSIVLDISFRTHGVIPEDRHSVIAVLVRVVVAAVVFGLVAVIVDRIAGFGPARIGPFFIVVAVVMAEKSRFTITTARFNEIMVAVVVGAGSVA